MLYSKYFASFVLAVPGAVALCMAGPASAATLTVGPPPNTYATLDAAFTAARSGDVIILDDAGSPYAVAGELVVTQGKSPLRIQGQFNAAERPDEIVIMGAAGGPVITAEQDAELTLRHLTVSGGTVGIQALNDSRVTLERVHVNATGDEGMSVTAAERVEITSSIFNACGAEGIIINTGTVDITQSTFIDNGDVAINLLGGDCEVGASLFFNNDGDPTGDQVAAAVAGLALDFCAVVQGTLPATVTETNDVEGLASFPGSPVEAAFMDPENELFDDTSPWRGRLEIAIPTEADSATIATDAPFGRDFIFMTRNLTMAQVGAHEFGAVASGPTWVDCIVTQTNNPTPGLVGLGGVNIEVVIANGSLANSILYLEPEFGLVTDPDRRIAIPLEAGPAGSENYATASITLSSTFVRQGAVNLLLDGVAELYLQVPRDGNNFPSAISDDYGTGPAPVFLNAADGFIEPAAEAGRFFTIDTTPPQIAGFLTNRAHTYVTGHTDILAPTLAELVVTTGLTLPRWSALPDANLASSVGVLDGENGSPDPHVFFNERDGVLDFTIRLVFSDSRMITDGTTTYTVSANGGFSPAPPTENATGGAIFDLLTIPGTPNNPTAGRAWWESIKSGMSPDLTTALQITYTGGGPGADLTVEWRFTGVPAVFGTVTSFWESIAQFGARDLAGNISGAANASNPLVYALNPLHIWQLYDAATTIEDGPGGRETTSPVVNWGLMRAPGVVPQNTDNAFPICQYAVYRHPTSTNPADVGWQLAGPDEWSNWIATRRIDKFAEFRGNTALGALIQAPGMYMIVARAADEAGNVASLAGYPGLGTLNINTIPNTLSADTWINGGPGISLDTRVTSVLWHNRPGLNHRIPDQGERVFGAATKVPLPPIDTCERVEAGFTITMDVPDSASTGAMFVYFELFEDGRKAAAGTILGSPSSSDVTLAIPEDLINPPAGLTLDPALNNLNFLNLPFIPDCVPLWGAPAANRLGDDGPAGIEPPNRERDVKYQLIAATGIQATGDLDETPATVEFTVTVDRGFKDDQPIKSFTKE